MRKTFAEAAAALALAAGVAATQLWLGHRLRVLVPDQDYSAGNDTWPFQLVLLGWCAACATVIGGVVGGAVVRDPGGRYLAAGAAAAGALVPLPLAVGWATGARFVSGDSAAAAVAAFLVGAVIGTVVAAAALSRPAIGRSAAAWAALVWLSVVIDVLVQPDSTNWQRVVPVHPLGLVTPGRPGDDSGAHVLGLLPPVVLAAVLGWWAARRSEPRPVLAAVVGPLLVAAVHLPVPWLPGGRDDGDHYSLGSDLSVWLVLSVLALASAALGAGVAGRRRSSPAAAAG